MGDTWEYGGAGMEPPVADPSVLELKEPKILLTGARRAGKSSIFRVLFSKMSPHETLFLEPTPGLEIWRIANSDLITFQVWDFPGDFDPEAEFSYGSAVIGSEQAYSGATAIVACIDAQDDLEGPQLRKIIETAAIASQVNPDIHLHVFLHKVDGDLFPSEDEKLETMNNLHAFMLAEIEDSGLSLPFNFSLTSIYDNSIFEAFSKVVHRLIPQLPIMENLLNTLNASCNIEKSFLFDVVSKLYYATDSNPVDLQTHELCSDMIDVVIDISAIYGIRTEHQHAYDAASASAIKLSNGMVLYLREVSTYLALVCLVRAENFRKRGLIDYNVDLFKQALADIFTAGAPADAAK